MKRKVGELNNIPIVEGDPNLLKSNEILHKGGGQLSKRDNTGEIKDLGSSDSGSDSGEGVKEYHYRVNTKHEQYGNYVELIAFLMIKDFILNGRNIHRVYGDYNLATLMAKEAISAICIFDYSVNSAFTQDDGDNGINLSIYAAPKGNIKEKVSQLFPSFESTINEVFIPITKEEYESLITQ